MAKEVTLEAFEEGERLGAEKMNLMRKALQQMQGFQGGFASGDLVLTRKQASGEVAGKVEVAAVGVFGLLQENVPALEILVEFDFDNPRTFRAQPGNTNGRWMTEVPPIAPSGEIYVLNFETHETITDKFLYPARKWAIAYEPDAVATLPPVPMIRPALNATFTEIKASGLRPVIVQGTILRIVDGFVESDGKVKKGTWESFVIQSAPELTTLPGFDISKMQIPFHKAEDPNASPDPILGTSFELDAKDCRDPEPPPPA